MKVFLAAAALAMGLPGAAFAQDAATADVAPSPALQTRIDQLIPLLTRDGTVTYDAFFAPSFQAEISEERFWQVAHSLEGQFGAPVEILDLHVSSPTEATFTLRFEEAEAAVNLGIETGDSQRVTILSLRRPLM